MKQKLLNLKSWLLLMLMCVSMGAWATTYTISFKTGTSDGSTNLAYNTDRSKVFSAGSDYVSSIGTCSKAYYGSKSGVKFGSSSAGGSMILNLASGCQQLKKVTVKTVKYGTDGGNVTLYNGNTQIGQEDPGTDIVKTYSSTTTVSSLKISSTARVYISEIILETEADAVQQYSYTLETFGSGTTTFKDGNGNAIVANQKINSGTKITPTFTPADGYEFTSWEYYSTAGEWKTLDAKTPFTITKDVQFRVTYTAVTPKAKYHVTIETPENGTLTIKDGETVINSGDEVEEGKTLTIEVEPADGYRFKNWGYKDGDAAWVGNMTSTFTHVMPSAPCSFKATFEEIPTYTVAWSVNGAIVKTEELKEGATVTAPTVEDINGKKFVGWVKTATVNAATAPTYETIGNATETVTYYAVFAAQAGGSSISKTVVFDAKGISTAGITYKESTKKDDGGNTWSYYASLNNYSGTYYFGLNTNANNYNIGSPEFEGNITSISIKAYNGSSKDDRKLLICSSNTTAQPTKGDIAEVTVSKSELFNTTYNVDLQNAGNFNKFYVYAAAALGISEITVTYGGGASYSDFTTLPAPAAVYNVNILTDEIVNGTVTADKETAAEGEAVTLTITPDEGYSLAQLMVINLDTDEEIDVEDNYSFVMPAANVEVFAYFMAAIPVTYTLSDIANGKVESSTMVSVSFNNEIIEISDNEGTYAIALKDGENTFMLMANVPCNTEWKEGGTLAGIWRNAMYLYQMPNSGAYMLINFTDPDPWSGLEYTAPAEITYTSQTLTFKATNDDFYWATFSSNEVTFWPNDYIVSAVGVENNALYKFDNEDAFDEDIVNIDEENTIDGFYVPANTGVLVCSADETATYYTVNGITPSNDVEAVNMLRPSTVQMEENGYKFYKLSYLDSKDHSTLGFYWGAENGAPFKSTLTNGAYLAVPESTGAPRGFRLTNDESTGIENINITATKSNVMYNLAGQRVNANAKGIIIVNGKKLLNK